MVAAWDIYAEQLMPLGYGHPLWGPEPDSELGEVRIGDVGYLQEGFFCFLFNAMHDADDPINSRRGVPEGFEVFDPPNPMLILRPNVITQAQLHSKSLQSLSLSAGATASVGAAEAGASASAGLRYQCSEESGAILMLKSPAHKEYLGCKIHIQKYMWKHLARWREFANDHLGIGLQEKDIIFVSGFTKTSVWAEAAFSNGSASGELVIAGGCFVPSATGEFRASLSRSTAPSVFCREGPLDRVIAWRDGSDGFDACDQCIFFNYYKMKSRGLWRRPGVMRAAAGPHTLLFPSEGDDGQSASAATASSDEDLDAFDSGYDPVDRVLDYILQHSNAQYACASDEDMASLFSVMEQDCGDNLDIALSQRHLPIICRYSTTDGVSIGTIDEYPSYGEGASALPNHVWESKTKAGIDLFPRVPKQSYSSPRVSQIGPASSQELQYLPLTLEYCGYSDLATITERNRSPAPTAKLDELTVLDQGRQPLDRALDKRISSPSSSKPKDSSRPLSAHSLPRPLPPLKSPRTTRRQMLQADLSESLRDNLLWQRRTSWAALQGQHDDVIRDSAGCLDTPIETTIENRDAVSPEAALLHGNQGKGEDAEDRG